MLFALAYAGCVIGYVPLLTLLLPLRVEAIAPGDKVALLSLATLVGAVAASASNILGGMLSDRSMGRPAGRRPWVMAGLVATLASYAVLYACRTPAALVAGVVMFQLALNFMLAPLMAIAADEAPDDQKGMVGGLFGAVYPLGALSGALITLSPRITEAAQFAMVAGLIAVCVLPFLILKRRAEWADPPSAAVASPGLGRRNLGLVWMARLLVQVAGNILFAYLLFYFQTVQPTGGGVAARVAQVSAVVAVVSVPVSLALGRLSDLPGARKGVLILTAAMITLGLVAMAMWPQWTPASIGYGLFAIGVGIFLALQSTYAMRLLPTPKNRGRDLGLLNLTNTLPAMIAPALAYVLLSAGRYADLMLILAGVTALAGVLMLFVREAD